MFKLVKKVKIQNLNKIDVINLIYQWKIISVHYIIIDK